MSAILPIILKTLWIISCAFTLVLSFTIVRRSFRRALRGSPDERFSWAERLDRGFGWLRWPVICGQVYVFFKYHDSLLLLTVGTWAACIMAGLVLQAREWKKQRSTLAH